MNAPAEKALMSNMPRHFLDLSDHSGETLKAMIADAKKRKLARLGLPRGVPDADAPLAGRVLAMIFDKQSTRTRISFDVGARQLGGTTLMLVRQPAPERGQVKRAQVPHAALPGVLKKRLDIALISPDRVTRQGPFGGKMAAELSQRRTQRLGQATKITRCSTFLFV